MDKTLEQSSFASRQQLVAPVKGRLEGLLALGRPSECTRQQVKPIVKSCRDLIDTQHPQTGRGEFDRQGKTVHPSTDFDHG
jgi:hypothetical protein